MEEISKRFASFRSPSRSAKPTKKGSSISGEERESGADDGDTQARASGGSGGEREEREEREEVGVRRGESRERSNFGGVARRAGEAGDERSGEVKGRSRPLTPSSDMNICRRSSVPGSESSASGSCGSPGLNMWCEAPTGAKRLFGTVFVELAEEGSF